MGFFQFGSLFIFVGQKLTKMTKADIVKQLAQETGVEAVTVSWKRCEPHRSARKTFSSAVLVRS